MMTTDEVAATLGVTHRTLYRTIKKTGMWWRLEKQHRGGTYLFSNDDVLELAKLLKVRHFGHLARTLTPNAYVRDASRLA